MAVAGSDFAFFEQAAVGVEMPVGGNAAGFSAVQQDLHGFRGCDAGAELAGEADGRAVFVGQADFAQVDVRSLQ